MKNVFFGLTAAFCSFAASAFGGEEASVLVPAPADAVVVETTPAVTVVESSNCACESSTARVRRSRVRYRIVTSECDACTGRPVTSVTRGVVRGTGAVVRGVGGVAYNVITLPARVCRNGRCN